MQETAFAAGIVCVAGAIIGGGFSALGWSVPVIPSTLRQGGLAVFGLALFGAALGPLADDGADDVVARPQETATVTAAASPTTASEGAADTQTEAAATVTSPATDQDADAEPTDDGDDDSPAIAIGDFGDFCSAVAGASHRCLTAEANDGYWQLSIRYRTLLEVARGSRACPSIGELTELVAVVNTSDAVPPLVPDPDGNRQLHVGDVVIVPTDACPAAPELLADSSPIHVFASRFQAMAETYIGGLLNATGESALPSIPAEGEIVALASEQQSSLKHLQQVVSSLTSTQALPSNALESRLIVSVQAILAEGTADVLLGIIDLQRIDLLARSDPARGNGCNYVQVRWSILARFSDAGVIADFGDSRVGAGISTSRPLDLRDLDPALAGSTSITDCPIRAPLNLMSSEAEL